MVGVVSRLFYYLRHSPRFPILSIVSRWKDIVDNGMTFWLIHIKLELFRHLPSLRVYKVFHYEVDGAR